MGSMSIWHWLIVAVIVLLLFGKGRISEVMGELGKGINSFKKGVTDAEKAGSTEEEEAGPPKRLKGPPATIAKEETPSPATSDHR